MPAPMLAQSFARVPRNPMFCWPCRSERQCFRNPKATVESACTASISFFFFASKSYSGSSSFTSQPEYGNGVPQTSITPYFPIPSHFVSPINLTSRHADSEPRQSQKLLHEVASFSSRRHAFYCPIICRNPPCCVFLFSPYGSNASTQMLIELAGRFLSTSFAARS